MKHLERLFTAAGAKAARDAYTIAAEIGPDAPPPCGRCKGAGYLVHDVPVHDPRFGQLVPCVCLAQAQATTRRAALASEFGACTFATFDRTAPGLEGVAEQCEAWAQRPEGWLILVGPYGCGKSHLAFAMADTAIAHGVAAVVSTTADLLDYLRNAYSPVVEEAHDQRLAALKSAPLLVLDDLGTESATSWAREKLFQILNDRYNRRRPTVITTNLDLDSPQAAKHLDGRILSRLFDQALCTHIDLSGAQDYRRLAMARRKAARHAA